MPLWLVLFIFCHFSTLVNGEKNYRVVARPFPISPFDGNITYTDGATMFNFNGTVGLVLESNTGDFNVVSMALLSNNTYAVDKISILPLKKESFGLGDPSITWGNGYYYLIYTESNSLVNSIQYAMAGTETPFDANTWTKIGNLAYPAADPNNDLEAASILWQENESSLHYLYSGRVDYDLNDGDGASQIQVTQGTSGDPLIWENQSKIIVENRPTFFDNAGTTIGPSPVPLKSGDYLLLYNAPTSTNTLIGYVILQSDDPTKVFQRSDEPLMPEMVSGSTVLSTRGLIPDPRGCPSNADDEIGPDFASNIECFIGIYSYQNLNTAFFQVISGWNDSTENAATTDTFISIESSTESTKSTTPETHVSMNSTTSTTTLLTSTAITNNSTLVLTSTVITETSTTSSATFSKSTLIVIFLSSVIVILIILAAVVYCFKRNKYRGSLIDLIVTQHEMPAEDAKALAETIDNFQLLSKQISINYDKKIGSGFAATVYEGFLAGDSAFANSFNKFGLDQKYRNCKVAIKIPKEISRTETEQIMRELQAMQQIGYHVHIAVLLGWCFQNDLISLVFEIAQQDLFTYICSFRKLPSTCLPMKQLFSIAWQVSVGMEHVASFNMVHRDLAARNVLLYDGFHAKISDFGLCCRCDESFTYQATLNKKLPLRWLSIEALMDRTFSEKSDVWAFGVLLFEMCTNGAVPYTVMSNNEILEFLQSGQRLEKPETANEELYDLMLWCWKESVEERFTFADVTKNLQTHLEAETQTYGYLSIKSEEPEVF